MRYGVSVKLVDRKLIGVQWNKAIGGDAAETGSGAGSYDIRQSVWHVNVSSMLTFSHSIKLTSPAVLQPWNQWRRWMGYIQRLIRLAKLRYLRIRDLIQSVLGCGHCRLPADEIQRDSRSLPIHEG